jgi:hypothetical protein
MDQRFEDCNHYDDGTGVCENCGLLMKTCFAYQAPQLRGKHKTIWNDLATKHELPEELRRTADEIFREYELPTVRKNNRARVILYCLIKASERLGYQAVYTPQKLVEIMGLKKTDVSIVNTIDTQMALKGMQVKTVIINLKDILKAMARTAGITPSNYTDHEKQITNLLEFSDQILDEKQFLNQYSTDSLAAALLYYYLQCRNFDFNPTIEQFSKQVGACNNKTKQIYDQIIA